MYLSHSLSTNVSRANARYKPAPDPINLASHLPASAMWIFHLYVAELKSNGCVDKTSCAGARWNAAMTLPVSSYEELLIQVRELTHETILLQRQLSSDLFENVDPPDVNHNFSFAQKNYEKGKAIFNFLNNKTKVKEILPPLSLNNM